MLNMDGRSFSTTTVSAGWFFRFVFFFIYFTVGSKESFHTGGSTSCTSPVGVHLTSMVVLLMYGFSWKVITTAAPPSVCTSTSRSSTSSPFIVSCTDGTHRSIRTLRRYASTFQSSSLTSSAASAGSCCTHWLSAVGQKWGTHAGSSAAVEASGRLLLTCFSPTEHASTSSSVGSRHPSMIACRSLKRWAVCFASAASSSWICRW
mmetsp:Transcript_16619/g.41919  ORF Transcript_16619/g.41919 Transcript_16619/m.41919 type:complete len:205 (-) Transcript_16619:199-813(-)